jgi:hypothetical protein
VQNNATKQQQYTIVFLHILGCITFLSIPVFSRPHGMSPFGQVDRHYCEELLEYAFTIGFFYLNYSYFIPRLYFKKRYALFVAAAIAGFLVVSVLPEAIITAAHIGHVPSRMELPGGPPPIPFNDRNDLSVGPLSMGPFEDNFLKYAAVFILAMTLKITEKLKRIQKEKAESEIMFLKAQINPHFLFNTLNSIYTLAIEAGANSAATAITQLSGMMRYATSEASAQTILLSKELRYIDNYITLQRLRINDKVKLSYRVEGEADREQIAPFLLIPFVENAFKYGVSTDQDSDIGIHITVTDEQMTLHVVNNKVFIAPGRDNGTSIGIDNTRKRLDLLYPGRHKLVITDTGEKFDVVLQVIL